MIYQEALRTGDFSALPFAPDFACRTPLGRLDRREFVIQDFLEDGDSVSVRYEAVTPVRRMPITEWYTLRNGLIARIEAFFDGAAAAASAT
jgi:hypothetical protein